MSGVTHSDKYLAYMESDEWQLKRLAVLGRAGYHCERCKKAAAREVHHLTYVHLGDEPLTDLQALCPPCHKKADRERAYAAALDTYATKRYGREWEENIDFGTVEDEFDRWLEDKEEEEWRLG